MIPAPPGPHARSLLDRRGSRRAFLVWSASGAAVGAVALGGSPPEVALAQDASGNPVVQPTALGPAVPDEVANHTADWPMLHGNYAGTRAAVDSPITAETVGQLEVAWRFPLAAQGGYGAIACTRWSSATWSTSRTWPSTCSPSTAPAAS